MQRVAAFRPPAMRNPWTDILIVSVANRELIVERVVDSQKPGSHVDLVIVIRCAAKSILSVRACTCVHVRVWNIGNNRRGYSAPKWVRRGNNIARIRITYGTSNDSSRTRIRNSSCDNPCGGGIEYLTFKDRTAQKVGHIV